jgi:hypothetical protein
MNILILFSNRGDSKKNLPINRENITVVKILSPGHSSALIGLRPAKRARERPFPKTKKKDGSARD